MTDQPPDAPSRPGFVPVCAIGASAGGVGVLQTLFRLLPDDLGLAYVVVVHLSPDHPSAMHEILGACTRMPVFQVQDGPTLTANCVYVIAPDRELVIEGDDVRSRPFTDPRGRRAPIDMFFRSIASARGDGIAVVLTGAGADGAVGVRAIKEAGGIVMVQEPAEAGFPSMPQNAIATGVADVVAPIARLAERIAEAARSKEAVRSLDEDGAAHDLRRIVAFLRTRTGHDFSGYKRATVLRRVTRRMQVCQIDDLDSYARHLRATPEEAKALFADLLISVTMFFRDPGAFRALAGEVVRPLLERAGEDDGHGEIRAWVVGCATGEEAYSLAILLLEEADRLKLHVPAQIFATDLDEGALSTAREGRYPRSIEADVSPERLKRFFVDEGTHYRVQRRVRDLVLFATHSVVREPPFMRLDLVTCRNVLIYLERALQQHVCAIFHYGLRPGGALFLGTAETADMVQDQFVGVDREARIYRARGIGGAPIPVLAPSVPMSLGRSYPAAEGRVLPPRFEAGEGLAASHAAALEASAPPSALVDVDHAVLHLSPTAGRFIRLSAGPLSGRLTSIVHPELRLDLKMALDRAFDTRQPTMTRFIDLRLDGAMRRVSVYVAPVPSGEGAAARATAFFLDNGPSLAIGEPENLPASEELRQLHGELKSAQEAALAGRIGHEAALQELRASNEELQSLNEEYRSTAEELETSKEELQSINEELQTVNAELKVKLSAISAAHDDLQNLTASSEIGTLFLDTGLRIRMFTPRVAELINITQADVGRPVTDFTHRLAYDGLEDDVRRVLRHLQPIETEVRGLGDRWFTLRVRPYRTLDDRIEGAVVTFDDVTDRRRGEAALRESEELRRSLITQMNDGFCILEVMLDEAGRGMDYRFVETNPAFLRQGGFDPAGRLMSEIAPIEPIWPATYGRVASTGVPERIVAAAAAFGRTYEVYAFRVGAPADRRIAVFFSDITARTIAQDELRASEERQAYLLGLSDEIRLLDDPRMIAADASRLLGEHLRADRTFLTEVEPDGTTLHVRNEYLRAGASSVLGRYSFGQFGAFIGRELHAGRTLAVEDVSAVPGLTAGERATYAAVGIAAYLLVPLLRDGRLAACLTVNHRTARAWTPAERGIARQTADRTWAAMEHARAEGALRASEEKYRTVFESIDEGFAIVEVILDGSGKPVDLLHLEANPAYERHTGLHDVVGRRALEIIPEGGPWLDFYGDVALTGQAARTETYLAAPIHRWVAAYASRIGGEGSLRVAIVFNDVTERKRADEVLRRSEGRQSFLLKLSDVLRPLSDPLAIQGAACRLLAERLAADRAYYVEVDEATGTAEVEGDYVRGASPSLVGRRPIASVSWSLATLRRGECHVVDDARTSPAVPDADRAALAALDVVACMGAPLVKDGRLVGALCVTAAIPRAWGPADVEVLREVAERIWAAVDRARIEAALAQSERRLRTLVEGVPQAVWRATETGGWTWSSPQWVAYTGLTERESRGDGWLAALHPDDRERARAAWLTAERDGSLDMETRVRHAATGAYRWFQTRALPVRDGSSAVTEWVGISTDIDDLRRLQERQTVMVAELQHRTRNLIAVVQGIADDTMTETGPTGAFRDAFFDRLAALSRVQGLLSRSEAEPITIGALVRLELEALGAGSLGGRAILAGPDVYLKPSTVQTLALALHELATNARKYGALSHGRGRLSVTWRERDDGGEPRLLLDWIETSPESPPESAVARGGGYGRELIERALPHAMGARTRYVLTASGLSCSLDIPVRPGRGGEA